MGACSVSDKVSTKLSTKLLAMANRYDSSIGEALTACSLHALQLETDLDKVEADLDEAEFDLSDVSEELDQTESELDATEAELDKAQTTLKAVETNLTRVNASFWKVVEDNTAITDRNEELNDRNKELLARLEVVARERDAALAESKAARLQISLEKAENQVKVAAETAIEDSKMMDRLEIILAYARNDRDYARRDRDAHLKTIGLLRGELAMLKINSSALADVRDQQQAHEVRQDEMIKKMNAELTKARRWVSDLQSGQYVNCVYCGHCYGPGEEAASSKADALKAHIEACPEHPMSAVKEELARLHAALEFTRENVDRIYDVIRRGPYDTSLGTTGQVINAIRVLAGLK